MALTALRYRHGRTQEAAQSAAPGRFTAFKEIACFCLPLPQRLRSVFAHHAQQAPQHYRIHQQPLHDVAHASADAVW